MKLYPMLPALLVAGALPAIGLATAAHRVPDPAPVSVAVRVTPRQLGPLDTATISATFVKAGTDSGPYTATLALRSGERGDGQSATQDGLRLHPRQPLTIYWEWRAGASLPEGRYAVQVRLNDATGHTVAAGTAPATLIVAGGTGRYGAGQP